MLDLGSGAGDPALWQPGLSLLCKLWLQGVESSEGFVGTGGSTNLL